MNRRNKKKIANWIFFGCAALTIVICVNNPTVITSGCAGVCTGLFIGDLIHRV